MFIYCNDEEVKQELLSQGYILLKEQGGMCVFANDNKKQFEKRLNNKVMFSNRMTF